MDAKATAKTDGTRAARLRDFLHDCAASAPVEEAERLREARVLFAAAAARFDALVDAGAGESAALALLPPGAGFLLSRGGGGVCLASVVSASGEEVTAEAATPALALLAAQAAAMLADAARARGRIDPALNPAAARLN